jgi:serine protease Do
MGDSWFSCEPGSLTNRQTPQWPRLALVMVTFQNTEPTCVSLRGVVMRWFWVFAVVMIPTTCAAQAKVDRETKVRNDKTAVEADARWIYNDLPKAFTVAKETNKPLLIVFRCIPCEACSRFDDLVVKRDERIQKLMDNFVCVRIVQANSMDLDLFQFDYDQSFHAFLMNADKTIYARFGTRSEHHDEFQDMTMEGFGEALTAAITLHKEFPKNKEQFAGKHGPKPPVGRPEEFPSLTRYQSKLDYEGNVVKSCMHCHQVRDAERETYRAAKTPMPDKVLYPFPLPHSVGLLMDPRHMATVNDVADGSPAKSAGFQAGDEILELGGQPLLSIADIQWVLHNAEDVVSIPARVRRNGMDRTLDLALPAGWRKKTDISWRPTTWQLRGWGSGGLVLTDLEDAERTEKKLNPRSLALLVKYVGQYNIHAAGKNAGFQKGDVIIRVDGKTTRMTESAFLAYSLNEKKTGDKIEVTVLRDGKEVALQLPVQ